MNKATHYLSRYENTADGQMQDWLNTPHTEEDGQYMMDMFIIFLGI